MSKKSKKRQEALKIEKRNKRIVAVTAAIIILAIIMAVTIVSINQQRGSRVYANGRNTVTLYRNGRFQANLPHGVVRRGTFSEVMTGIVTTVSFVQDGLTTEGVINGDMLTIPPEWDDGHSHPRNYLLRR
ncbi:MAG: hypothetical protein FWC92_02050 [Defluviitaleaceae bacterium]|nr:hypothetical protein [Defluviitaleaceae bacterium]